MVNSPLIARERNIAVSQIKHPRHCDYQTLISLTVTTEKRSRSVAGTLFAGNRPRIVQIKGINIEAELGPHMLYIANTDKPGIIGRLGMALADANINIATFHLGRPAKNGDAIALIQVDEPLSEEVLAKVRAIDGVRQATALRF